MFVWCGYIILNSHDIYKDTRNKLQYVFATVFARQPVLPGVANFSPGYMSSVKLTSATSAQINTNSKQL
jgi:hypothetical protein